MEQGREPSRFALTDLGNAERFVARHKNEIRFSNQLGVWFVWDGCRWVKDAVRAVMHMAAMSNRDIDREAAQQESPTARQAWANWATKSESRQRIEATAEVAKCQPGIAVRVEEMDADPWKFNVRNGTINLKTGTLMLARREDLMTKLAPVDYDPEAECPQFMSFFGRILAGDADLIDFVQTWLGHCLTGDITEQYLPIFFGDGNNGKNVLMDTVVAIMGDYAGLAAPSLMTESNHKEHPTEIADLVGLRLVVASETEGGEKLRLQLIKRITGDRQLKGRFMRQDFFTFDRTFKTIMITNNRPRIRESTEAAWRRLRIVPFEVVVPPEERDPKLMEKLKAEWPGILRFLVEGCVRWVGEGLKHPAAVMMATESYRESEDGLGRFYREVCIADPQASVPWKAVRGRYETWASDNGETPVTERELGKYLDGRGHESKQVRDGRDTAKHRQGLLLRGFEMGGES